MITNRNITKEEYIKAFLYNKNTFDIVKYKDDINLIIDNTISDFINHNIYNLLDTGNIKEEVLNIDKWIIEINQHNLSEYINYLIDGMYIHTIDGYHIQNIELIKIGLYNGYFSMFNKVRNDFIGFLEMKNLTSIAFYSNIKMPNHNEN